MRGDGMDYKKAHKILERGIMLAVALWVAAYVIDAFGGADFEPIAWVLFIIGTPAAFVSVRIGRKYYKCPYCGERLSLRENIPRFCPHCGEGLEGEGRSEK